MNDLKWLTVKKKVKDLKFHPKNPRVYDEKAIEEMRKVLEEEGYRDLVSANLNDVLVSGHRRITVMLKDGKAEEEIEVRVPTRLLTDQEHEKMLLRANKVGSDKRFWDYDMLNNQFDEIMLEEVGFTEIELGALPEEPKEKKDKEPKTKTVSCPDCGKFFDIEL